MAEILLAGKLNSQSQVAQAQHPVGWFNMNWSWRSWFAWKWRQTR